MVPKLQAFLAKPFMPAVFFFAGVGYDTLTLTRIDRLLDNLVLLLYLSLLGALIILSGREEFRLERVEGLAQAPAHVRWFAQIRPYAPMAIQFLLGGLFSAYAVFYFRSASLTGTAVFMGLLVALLVANEFLKRRLSNLTLLITLYAVVCFSFFTLFLPVMLRSMNLWVFLLGAVLTVAVILRLVQLTGTNNPAWPPRQRAHATGAALGVVGLLVGFYFLNWIPPVPLSMKFGGVYHEVRKVEDRFELVFEKQWYQFWKRSANPYPADEPVYCFTAVFAPVRLEATIAHHWYHRPNGHSTYMHADRIPIKIAGGRAGGYRAVTFKQRLDPGDWRVDVETEDGRVLGYVKFRVEPMYGQPTDLVTLTY